MAAAMAWGQSRMEITLEKRESGAWKVVDPGHVFREGDQLRFRFKASQAGFLYVVNEGTSGEQTQLFPSAQAGNNNSVEAGKEYTIPGSSGAFRVTGPKGYDTVYWVVSPVKIGSTVEYKPLPPPPAPTASPSQPAPNLTPRCDDSIFRARGECVDAGAGLKTNPVPGMKARELFFVRKGEQSIVSAPPAAVKSVAAAPITYQFRIAHQ